MTIGLTLSILALAAMALFLWKKNREITEQLRNTRGYYKTFGVQIICGNCSGESEIPIRTNLDAHGNCTQCGGKSYVLAATLGAYALLARAAPGQEHQAPWREAGVPINTGRVISLQEHRAARREQVEKLAS